MSSKYLKRIVREVIAESDIRSNVIDAIKKRYEVTINYQPENEGGRGKRVIQPVAYGTSKAGNLVIRAYQPYGDTSSEIPRWKLFRLDRITSWKGHRGKKFSVPPSTYGSFNPEGDNGMSNVFVISNFDTSRYERSGLKRYNDERHNAAVERDPLHNMRRNVRNSQKLGDVDYVKRNLELWKNSQAAKDFHTNKGSIDNMRSSGNFNNNGYETTNEPVKKGDYRNTAEYENPQNGTENADYGEIEKIGPVSKNNKDDKR